MEKLLSPECFEKRYKARLAHLKRDLEIYDDGSLELVEDLLVTIHNYLAEYESLEIQNATLNVGHTIYWIQRYIYED